MTDPTATDRLGLEVLSTTECWSLLAATPVGRVGFIHGGEPVVLPVTYAVTGRTIVFRTNLGSKMMAAYTGQVVAFEVDEWEAFSHSGWSVLAKGRAETVHATAAIHEFEAAHLVPWLDAAQDGVWIRIRVEEISGRRLPDRTVGFRGTAT